MPSISIYPIDPVAFSIGFIEIKWYGLSYVGGLLFGWFYIKNLVHKNDIWQNSMGPFPPSKTDDLLVYITAGVLLGGRLGFVFFYEPSYYYSNPWDIFAIWRGGMAFHGGLLGCGLAIWLYTYRNRYNLLSTMDVCAATVPIGLLFGRLANFVNGELWGRPTDMPWGIIFPSAQEYHSNPQPLTRHPSQLYEAAFEGLALFMILRLLSHNYGALRSPGLLTGAFLLGYGITRSFCELFREFDPEHIFSNYGFTPGIVYSIPMILLGLWFIRFSQTRITV
ncbi:MAG: Phosphatidylglycerol--prolipoprotein diacylglyceryl transferase [Hyphomicrobiaceae bacterium hypho_1]